MSKCAEWWQGVVRRRSRGVPDWGVGNCGAKNRCGVPTLLRHDTEDTLLSSLGLCVSSVPEVCLVWVQAPHFKHNRAYQTGAQSCLLVQVYSRQEPGGAPSVAPGRLCWVSFLSHAVLCRRRSGSSTSASGSTRAAASAPTGASQRAAGASQRAAGASLRAAGASAGPGRSSRAAAAPSPTTRGSAQPGSVRAPSAAGASAPPRASVPPRASAGRGAAAATAAAAAASAAATANARPAAAAVAPSAAPAATSRWGATKSARASTGGAGTRIDMKASCTDSAGVVLSRLLLVLGCSLGHNMTLCPWLPLKCPGPLVCLFVMHMSLHVVSLFGRMFLQSIQAWLQVCRVTQLQHVNKLALLLGPTQCTDPLCSTCQMQSDIACIPFPINTTQGCSTLKGSLDTASSASSAPWRLTQKRAPHAQQPEKAVHRSPHAKCKRASRNREQTGRYGIRSGHATVRGSPGQACLPEAATTHSRVVAVKLPLQAGQRARRRARRHPAQAAC